MAEQKLPKYFNPFELATRGMELKGNLSLQELQRVAEVVGDKNGRVQVHLVFGKDLAGFKNVTGTIAVDLQLKCQRCLQPFSYQAELPVSLSPVANEAAAERLPKAYEPLFVTDEQVILAEMIEEELLLSLPLIPKHENKCPSPPAGEGARRAGEGC